MDDYGPDYRYYRLKALLWWGVALICLVCYFLS